MKKDNGSKVGAKDLVSMCESAYVGATNMRPRSVGSSCNSGAFSFPHSRYEGEDAIRSVSLRKSGVPSSVHSEVKDYLTCTSPVCIQSESPIHYAMYSSLKLGRSKEYKSIEYITIKDEVDARGKVTMKEGETRKLTMIESVSGQRAVVKCDGAMIVSKSDLNRPLNY